MGTDSEALPAKSPIVSQKAAAATGTPRTNTGGTTTSKPGFKSTVTNGSKDPVRPGVSRTSTTHSRYMNMLLDAADAIPRMHNILISFFTWILLAGYLVFPGTFTSLQSIDEGSVLNTNETLRAVVGAVKNLPLVVVASVATGIGAIGMLWFWYRWRHNYVWLLNSIFLPGFLNSLAGAISTLVNVYAQQNGTWSLTAKITIIVVGSIGVINGALFVLYEYWMLERVRRAHEREMREGGAGKEGEGEGGGGGEHGGHADAHEGLVDKIERVVHEPGMEPGSVV